MALTANQQRLIDEVLAEYVGRDDSEQLRTFILQLRNATETQIITGLKQFASRRRDALQAQIDNLTIERDFYAGEAA